MKRLLIVAALAACLPLGPWARPAIVHDFLCDTLGTGEWRVDDEVTFLGCTRVKPYSSKEAAEIFREALEIPELKIPAWRRAAMYRAVRHFGPRWP